LHRGARRNHCPLGSGIGTELPQYRTDRLPSHNDTLDQVTRASNRSGIEAARMLQCKSGKGKTVSTTPRFASRMVERE
jgi:hypothetical protein